MGDKKEDLSFLISFIELVQQNPCLWNCTLKSYINNDLKCLTWKNIAAALKDTEQNCRVRWKNIRCAYVRTFRPQKSASQKTKKSYYLAEHLSFLQPYMKGRTTCGHVSAPETSPVENDNYPYENLELRIDSFDQDTKDPCSTTEEASKLSDTGGQSQHDEESKVILQRPPPLYRKIAPKNKAFEEWLDIKKITNDNEKPQDVDLKQDADLMFFQSLLPDFKKLNDRRKRDVKAKIMSLINNALDEDETWT